MATGSLPGTVFERRPQRSAIGGWTTRGGIVLLLAVLGMEAPSIHPAPLEDAAAIRERARGIISGGRYQDRLDAGASESSTAERVPLPKAAHSGLPRESGTPTPLRDIARVLLYGLMVTLAVIAMVAVVRSLRPAGLPGRRYGTRDVPRWGDKKTEGAARGVTGADPPARELLADADRLAAAGRWGEAVHLLLLATLDGLSCISGAVGNRSHTSRELVDLLNLDAEKKGALRHLVRVVEASLFGGRDVSRTAFADCRHHFETLCKEAPA